jgi:hypothetical protein
LGNSNCIFAFQHKQFKNWHIAGNCCFQTLGNRQCRAVLLEWGDRNEVSPINDQTITGRCFQVLVQGGGSIARMISPMSWGERVNKFE